MHIFDLPDDITSFWYGRTLKIWRIVYFRCYFHFFMIKWAQHCLSLPFMLELFLFYSLGDPIRLFKNMCDFIRKQKKITWTNFVLLNLKWTNNMIRVIFLEIKKNQFEQEYATFVHVNFFVFQYKHTYSCSNWFFDSNGITQTIFFIHVRLRYAKFVHNIFFFFQLNHTYSCSNWFFYSNRIIHNIVFMDVIHKFAAIIK